MSAAAVAPAYAPRDYQRELEDALRTELRLIEQLHQQLLLQREAVASNDAAAVDETVHASGRVLNTLEEARRRRRQLCLLLLGDADALPAAVPDLIGAPADSPLRVVIASLLAAADTMNRTITVNRRVLDGALRSGRDLIRVLHGEPPGGLVYERDARASAAGGSVLVNRRI